MEIMEIVLGLTALLCIGVMGFLYYRFCKKIKEHILKKQRDA